MQRYFWIILCIPLTLYVLFMILYANMLNTMAEAADDEYANVVANYCADAATTEMLTTADLGLDYANDGEITVDPELAVQEYGSTLAIAMGYQPTQQMINNVLRENVKVLYVCGYDGYYVYQNEKTGDSEYNFVGTFKLPYTYTDNGSLYALTLGGHKCWKLVASDAGTSLMRKQDCGLAPDVANAVINDRISKDMNSRITKIYEGDGNGWSNRVYIPSALTSFSSVSPVTSPTVLAFMDGINGSTAFGIGGTKIVETRKVAGYETTDGIKYYCYVNLLPESLQNSSAIKDLFDSIDDAAQAGYHFDPHYMK